jgi:hypothetical protein
MLKYILQFGGKFLGTNSKKVAEELAKQGGKRIPKSKLPSNAKVKKAPSVTQPRSPSSGRMQTNSNPPAAAKTTAPKIVRNKPTSLTKPRKDNAPAVRTSTNKPSVSSTSPKRGSSGASYSRVKSNPPKAKNDSKIVGISPKGKAVLAAPALAGSLPEVGTESRPTKKVEKKVSTGGPKTRPNNKPKKKTTPTPKGPMTLTKYLNDEIKKRGSSVTAEKKGSDKYTSIAAAKKAGSLYYKNTKTGKTMAAVYKEDLTN